MKMKELEHWGRGGNVPGAHLTPSMIYVQKREL